MSTSSLQNMACKRGGTLGATLLQGAKQTCLRQLVHGVPTRFRWHDLVVTHSAGCASGSVSTGTMRTCPFTWHAPFTSPTWRWRRNSCRRAAACKNVSLGWKGLLLASTSRSSCSCFSASACASADIGTACTALGSEECEFAFVFAARAARWAAVFMARRRRLFLCGRSAGHLRPECLPPHSGHTRTLARAVTWLPFARRLVLLRLARSLAATPSLWMVVRVATLAARTRALSIVHHVTFLLVAAF